GGGGGGGGGPGGGGGGGVVGVGRGGGRGAGGSRGWGGGAGGGGLPRPLLLDRHFLRGFEGGDLGVQDRLAAQPGLVGLLAAAHAEQALGQHQVEDQAQVDQEGPHTEHGDLVG